MSAGEIVDDLNQLRDLLAHERDPARSHELAQLRRLLAARAGGVKVDARAVSDGGRSGPMAVTMAIGTALA